MQVMKEFEMKIHSTTSAGNRNAIHTGLPRKENLLLAAAVTLAFTFVATCVFMLG